MLDACGRERFSQNVPGLLRAVCCRHPGEVRREAVSCQPLPDIVSVLRAPLVKSAIDVASGGRRVFGLGMTQQNQPAHRAISFSLGVT